MGGEHWFLGGYYNNQLIAKLDLDECSIYRQQQQLSIPHTDGFSGSCAVYNDAAHLCFDDRYKAVGPKKCQTFDGENESVLPVESNAGHVSAAMAIYQEKMWVVGGCESEDLSTCHNSVEFFDGNAWTQSARFPEAMILAHIVLADENGLYTIAGWHVSQRDVYMFKNTEWKFLGKMSESTANSKYFTSGIIAPGSFAYAGENSIEKIYLNEENFSSTDIGKPEDGNDMQLEYATMILVHGPVCSS
ncbi:Oidioi.mRNA.OKI2018_I69.chr2.g4663.t1.cds [Oikopleura dioica]|uniref:Oidioi.mRNA.OKI2018_I69.chr2.g4663.t1.cds n=1 Tax=Oikopleura dioica TaxID=34765 RepID=A0ABN7T754_OIKDI|nr:Oidioi.mRNA.OKI2018_I69.chr2.g4663.t1.cds [Oikopleura dioica]